MKIPNSGKRKALIVVDVQPAFIRPHNEHILENIKLLIGNVPYDAYVEAVFHAEKNSLWDIQQHWTAPANEDTHTVPSITAILEPHQPLKVSKETRSVFRGDADVRQYLRDKNIEEVHLVGTETNDCVLATAFDAFDSGFLPYVIEECCESATEGRHELGVKILRIQGMSNNRCIVDTMDIRP